MADFNGTPGPDSWVGTGDNETAHGGDGNDDLQGGGGNDTIYGEGDEDTLNGDDGNDTIWGGTGLDHLFGGAGDDIFWAHHADLAAGEDYHGGSGTDTVLISTGASAIDLTGLVLDSIESLQAGALLVSGDPNITVTMTADQLNGLNNLYIGFGTLVISTAGTVDFTGGTLQLVVINLNAAGNTLNLSAVNVLNYSPTDGPYIYGGAASDTVFGSDNHDRIYGNDGDDILHGGRFGSDLLDGGAGNDRLYFTHMSSSDAFYGGSGIDTFDASTATAAVTVALGVNPGDTGSGPGGSQLHDVENLDGSTFGDTLTGDSGANRLQGLAGNDTLAGEGGDDVLVGGADNDTLNGGAGNDDLAGGTGNDIYHVDSAGDVVTEAAGEGSDAIYASVSYALAAAAEIETLAVLDANGTTAINLTGNALANTLFGNAGANILDGGAGADTLLGRAGNDVYIVDDAGDLVLENGGEGIDEIRTALASYSLAGSNVENLTGLGTGNQTLTGNGAANVIDGGTGADTMAGGLGDDVYVVDNAGDVVTELAGEGIDEIRTGLASYTLGDTIENLTGLAAGGQTLTGNGINNVISGGSGNDFLVGGAGNDTMAGGAGNDTYYVDAAGDVVNETAGQGNDRIATSASYALAAGSEVEQLEAVSSAATDAMDLTGNQFANTITGNAGVNVLRGDGGNDILAGLAGNDYLVGGTGADFMYGGTGDDTYYVDNAGDQTSEQASEGTDRIATSISYALLTNSEIELLEGVNTTDTNAIDLTGSNFANLIIGNAGVNILRGEGGNDTLVGLVGNDFLVGGTGADLMYGGVGDDTYYVDDLGDQANEASGEGTDRIATSISFALQATSEVELLETVNTTDTSAMDLTGSNFANAIIGSNGVNILRGEGGNDTLTALGGNDFLVGGTGNDAMYGGAGNDTYYVDSAGDTVTELAGQGNDRIATSASYTLAAGSEVETLEAINRADTGAMDLTGNAFANTIAGNDGANILDGKGGNDLLVGYGGADTFAFTYALGADNVGQIADFVSGTDKIALDDAAFSGLAPGALPAGAFVIGAAALDADDRVVYNSATGELFFDADGNGVGAAVLFATLQGHPALAATDFIII